MTMKTTFDSHRETLTVPYAEPSKEHTLTTHDLQMARVRDEESAPIVEEQRDDATIEKLRAQIRTLQEELRKQVAEVERQEQALPQ